jgi:hypothetical protein
MLVAHAPTKRAEVDLSLVDLTSEEVLWTQAEVGSSPYLALGPFGRTALCGSRRRLRGWDQQGQQLWETNGRRGPFTGLALLADASFLLVGTNLQQLELRSLDDGQPVEAVTLRRGPDYDLPMAIAVTPDGRYAAVGTSKGLVLRYALDLPR